MTTKLHPVSIAILAALLCSCAVTSLKTTWKSPDYHGGPVQKVAVLAVDERGMVRQIFEGQFVTQLEKQGQAAFKTQELLALPAIKENKEAAAARLREAGADSVLIVRLVDSATLASSVRQTSRGYAPITTGYANFGWYDYYTVAFMDMDVIRNSLKQYVYLDTSLYELNTGTRLWSGLTQTVLKDNTDRLEVVRPLVTKVLAAMRQDGLIR